MPVQIRVARPLKKSLAIVPPGIERYLSGLDHAQDPALSEIEQFARTQFFRAGGRVLPFPIIGRQVGQIICQLALLCGAKRVFEMGSGFGYSGYWFAKAMGRGGELFLTDGSAQNLDRARGFISRLRSAPKLNCMPGDAIRSFRSVKGFFDIVFVDLDKKSYPDAFHIALKRIRPGGLLIADNTLWSGRVANPENNDADTRAIRKFNKMIFSDPRLISSILPVRDGLAVCLKKK